MRAQPCPTCGRPADAAKPCPHCGAAPGAFASELAKIEAEIADIAARDVQYQKQRTLLSRKMQAAMHRRALLANAHEERLRHNMTRQKRPGRRRPPRVPPTERQPPPTAPIPEPAQPFSDEPRRDGHSTTTAIRPEASTRSVQNILLGLGALLLGVAAVAFAGVAISTLDDLSRTVILIAATILTLVVPPPVARRRLTATAETIAAVGLLLIPLDGYALWTVDQIWLSGVSWPVYASVIFASTAVISYLYARGTGLIAPRYATVLALQPILPLLAYEWISGPAGWAFALAAVAALDIVLARVLPIRLAVRPGAAGERRLAGDVRDRPEGAPEESDAVVALTGEVIAPDRARQDREGPTRAAIRDARAGTDRSDAATGEVIDAESTVVEPPEQPRIAPLEPPRPQPGQQAAADLLPQATWLLHGIAYAAALVYATWALVIADPLPDAVLAATALLVAAGVGLAGGLVIGRQPMLDIASGVMTLAVIAAIGRVAAVAMPGRAMLVIAAAVALTSIAVRAVPALSGPPGTPPVTSGPVAAGTPGAAAVGWRGPQVASAIALAVVGVVVAAAAMRAAIAPIRAATPVWDADLSSYPQVLAQAVDPVGWQLVISALLLTIAAALALPADVRRESTVAGAALTTLAAPASLGLSWQATPWLLLAGAVGIGAAGLTARDLRASRAHLIGGGITGLFAAGAAAARPGLTAAVLAGLTVAGALIAVAALVRGRQVPDRTATDEIGAWATGGAALALPGAAVAGAVTGQAATPIVLAAGFLGVSVALAVAAFIQVSQREVRLPLTLGPGLGALAVAAASFGAPGSTIADAWVGALLMVTAILLFLAPSIDTGRRADRMFDGSDVATAAVTGCVLASLTRLGSLLAPGTELVIAAGLILLIATGVRQIPAQWRRGPMLGITAGGAVVVALAGFQALLGGLKVLSAPGPIWHADLSAWPTVPDPNGWQAPVALLLLAVAAAVVLPPPASYDAAAVCVGLATVGAPIALGLPWWSPILIDGAVAAAYGCAAVVARDPRAGRARAAVAAAVALHAVGAGLVRPWTTAAALLLVTLLGAVVAVLARALPALLDPIPARRLDDTLVDLNDPVARVPVHLTQIGGAALAGALLAFPGAVAAIAAGTGRGADVVLAGSLAASSLGLAIVASARRQIPGYLPYATIGVAGGATITAAASLPTAEPSGVYAAAAALLGVIAELIRGHTVDPAHQTRTVRRWAPGIAGPILRQRAEVFAGPTRWAVSPPRGAFAVAVLPGILAIVSIAPALKAALFDPMATVRQIWQGPPAILLDPPAAAQVDGTGVVTALLLTLAAALAAVGFGGGHTAQAFPVVLPGLAATILIAPVALRVPWPAVTLAGLAVFTLCMLGVALTPPPPDGERARPLRITRHVAFLIGLAAGGAGLAGSLATESLTLVTLGGAVLVGLTAALGGRTQLARILGWLFASVFAQLFALTAGLVADLDVHWSAFGVLGVGALLLVVAGLLPRLRRPEAIRERAAVEWSGHAAALLALALTLDSTAHVAVLLAAWGAVLGIAAARPDRRSGERRIFFWSAVGCEIVAWWILMSVANVTIPEAYTLPFAALALLVGVLELRERPDIGSWMAYGPALLAAFVPTLVIVVTTENQSMRQVLLLFGAVATLVAGSMRRQRAPVMIGAVVTGVTALHALIQLGPWLVLIPVGLLLLGFGANNEKNRRDLQRLRGALNRMR